MVDLGLVESRNRAQAMILEGVVYVNGIKCTKAGKTFRSDSSIEIRKNPIPYVSRGGIKLAHALDRYEISVEGKICMDVGASTGGFTDCLLQRGARKVYAVDVGYGQLAWKLRKDSRVVVLERQNIRYLPRDLVPDPIDLATVDTSFISLKLVIPAVVPFLAEEALLITLIKPQFEAGRDKVGKGGVVKDEGVQREVCDIISNFVMALGFKVYGIEESPIRGQNGNREFIMVSYRGHL
ncbi:MAG: TlyA family RNA methyltransferase [Syntrophobacterales bacterium]|nr:TlyA family RNA methyltransferase [Syntrophobacterales bacterium]